MSTIEEVRRENARLLAKDVGSQSRFGLRLDMSRQQVNHIIGSRPVKNIGSDLARRIESAFGRPVGWMDERRQGSSVSGSDIIIQSIARPGSLTAALAPLADATVHQIGASKEWLRLHVGARSPETIALATVSGDALQRSLPDGSMVLIDRSVSSLREDGIYMLARRDDKTGATWFRRVHRSLDGTYRMSAEVDDIEAMTSKSANPEGLLVLGRVVVALEIKRV